MSPALPTADVHESAYLEAIRRLDVHDHLCLIYETPEEQFGALVPFLRFGLERGERGLYIADQTTAEQVLDTLDAAGIDVAAATDAGALSVVTKRESYLRDGYFDPERMLALLAESVGAARSAGFKALRVTGEMTWALAGAAGSERLMEYESKLNHFLPGADVVAICQYNRRFFPAELIKQVIETHPLVIHGATVCRNPYYVPPEEFMGPRDPSREVGRLLASLVERERSEPARRRSEARLARMAAILEETPDFVSTADLQRGLEFINRAGRRMLGIPEGEDVRGTRIPDFHPAWAYEIVAREGIPTALREGSWIGETALLARDGREIPVSQIILAHRNAAGDVEYLSTIMRDISERKATEKG
jgi:PAS domain S-box-containing protein